MEKRKGKQSILLSNHPTVLSCAAIAGKKEGEGPLGNSFDYVSKDTHFGQKTWEKSESKMQELALDRAREKAGLKNKNIDALFAGDLLNQCISSSYCLRGTGIPFFGLYGACSTMAEGISLAALMIDGGYANHAAAMTSSHYAGAERQYRFPLVYGGQRTPTAQWTVTGAGCMILSRYGAGPYVNAVTQGAVTDYGIKDANNMGAAMAPAAYETIRAHFDDLALSPSDYDLILTGDLGTLGKTILLDFFERDGVHLQERYNDCGCMVFDAETQDVHSGGSGCGCSAITLCGHIMQQIAAGTLKNVLFCATGALLSPLSVQQGETIPGICHAVSFGSAGW